MTHTRRSILVALGLLGACLAGPLPAPAQTVIDTHTPLRERDVIFVPTEDVAADAMMRLAGVSKSDVVYDLGCGDGALLIAAAKRGARVVGIDIDPRRIAEAGENVRAAGVQDRVTLIRGDLFDPDLKISDATVVTLYLLQTLNERLAPRLRRELKPGTRVVSHAFTMGPDWPPEKTEALKYVSVYLWTIK